MIRIFFVGYRLPHRGARTVLRFNDRGENNAGKFVFSGTFGKIGLFCACGTSDARIRAFNSGLPPFRARREALTPSPVGVFYANGERDVAPVLLQGYSVFSKIANRKTKFEGRRRSARMRRTKPIALLLGGMLLVFESGCTNVQLRNDSVKQARTLSEIYEQQVLDNLSQIRLRPLFHAAFRGGDGRECNDRRSDQRQWERRLDERWRPKRGRVSGWRHANGNGGVDLESDKRSPEA